ncbi:aspartate/glutamate racemase family protein [Candidatus Daviesbacteria bacterium]|nr:aspartate/glutamate racemase family protein [Candidatus Daviesbacteria bacterium]
MKKQKPIIGILGGMGPQASVHLVKLLVVLSVKEFGAKDCQDFPEIILVSTPHPDFISNKKNSKIVAKRLCERIKKMEDMSVSLFALACNTAHILLDEFKSVSKATFVSMIDEIIKQLRSKRINKVGLLASPTTFKSGLFQKAFRPERSVWPERWVYY